MEKYTMKNIVAIRYTDASYTEKNIKQIGLPVYISIGELQVFTDHLVVVFNKKNGLPDEGLLIPKNAIIVNKTQHALKSKDMYLRMKEGQTVGIFWTDIVYFTNGRIPKKCSTMYTEGTISSVTSDIIVIKNPETLSITDTKVENHPSDKASFYIIPKSLITSLELYED
jgi:hypothetical protein